MATQPDRPIRGSWEDLLQNAQQLAANYNDDAIPLFEKLVTRLSKIPKAQRHAADERLQNILMQAAVDLHQYLLMRERYDEALTLLDLLVAEESNDESDQWANLRGPVLVQAGRPDETVAMLQTVAQEPDADLEDWHSLAMLQLWLERIDDAKDTLERMESWIDARYEDENPEARHRDVAMLEMARATAAIDSGYWAEGVDHFNRAIELDSDHREQLPGVYVRLLVRGRHDEAIPLIRRDQQSQVRPSFWLGYAYHLSGEREQAEKQWENALTADMTKTENQQFLEWVLSSYYLHDAEGVGLSTVLRVLQEQESRYWMIFLLAGLGWAIRNDLNGARTNLETAVLQCRASIDGRLIPRELWIHFEALVDEEMQLDLIEFFDVDSGTTADSDVEGGVLDEEASTAADEEVQHE